MAQVVFPVKPRLLKSVPKPTTVANSELAQAEPVYIDGLPAAGVTQSDFDALVARVEALETP